MTGYQTALLAAASVFIAFALIVALVVPRARPEFPGKRLGVFVAVCVALFAVQMGAVLALAAAGEEDDEPRRPRRPRPRRPRPRRPRPRRRRRTRPRRRRRRRETTESETTETETTETETTERRPRDENDRACRGRPGCGEGRSSSAAGCAGCHTLADAGATGTIGPDLDQCSRPALVVERVTNGSGVMPSFSDSLTEQQIRTWRRTSRPSPAAEARVRGSGSRQRCSGHNTTESGRRRITAEAPTLTGTCVDQ